MARRLNRWENAIARKTVFRVAGMKYVKAIPANIRVGGVGSDGLGNATASALQDHPGYSRKS